MKTFIVRYRYVSMCEVAIDAKGEAEARKKFDNGDFGDALEVDSIDSEIVSVKEDKS